VASSFSWIGPIRLKANPTYDWYAASSFSWMARDYEIVRGVQLQLDWSNPPEAGPHVRS